MRGLAGRVLGRRRDPAGRTVRSGRPGRSTRAFALLLPLLLAAACEAIKDEFWTLDVGPAPAAPAQPPGP